MRNIKNHSIADLRLDKLTAAAVTLYRDDRLAQVSSSSVRRELAVLQHCLHVANVEWGIALQRNSVAEIKKPSENVPRQRRITAEELAGLRSAVGKSCNPLLASIVQFAIHTGMRRGEILSFRWCDFDHAARTAHLADTKNGHPRVVPLSPSAIAALPARASHERTDDRVFPVSPNALRLAWERLKRRAKIRDLRFHDLRHEAISRFFELGLSVPEVSLISGHKDARMLFRYTHLKPELVAEKLRKVSD